MLSSLFGWRRTINSGMSHTEYMQQVAQLPEEDRPAAASLYCTIDDSSIMRALHTFRQQMSVPRVRQG